MRVWLGGLRGTARPMHRMGFELPERTGFGGLWSAMDETGEAAPLSAAVERHVVARSDGARSPLVRARLGAFRRAQAVDADEDAAA
jgi:hypothetical protein